MVKTFPFSFFGQNLSGFRRSFYRVGSFTESFQGTSSTFTPYPKVFLSFRGVCTPQEEGVKPFKVKGKVLSGYRKTSFVPQNPLCTQSLVPRKLLVKDKKTKTVSPIPRKLFPLYPCLYPEGIPPKPPFFLYYPYLLKRYGYSLL